MRGLSALLRKVITGSRRLLCHLQAKTLREKNLSYTSIAYIHHPLINSCSALLLIDQSLLSVHCLD